MAEYTFTRTFSGGKWDINNPNDVDGDGFAVTLAARIKTALPGLIFNVQLGSDCKVIFQDPLTGAELTILENTVATHKAASGTPNQSRIEVWTSANGTEFSVCIDNAGAWVIT